MRFGNEIKKRVLCYRLIERWFWSVEVISDIISFVGTWLSYQNDIFESVYEFLEHTDIMPLKMWSIATRIRRLLSASTGIPSEHEQQAPAGEAESRPIHRISV